MLPSRNAPACTPVDELALDYEAGLPTPAAAEEAPKSKKLFSRIAEETSPDDPLPAKPEEPTFDFEAEAPTPSKSAYIQSLTREEREALLVEIHEIEAAEIAAKLKATTDSFPPDPTPAENAFWNIHNELYGQAWGVISMNARHAAGCCHADGTGGNLADVVDSLSQALSVAWLLDHAVRTLN